MSQEVISASQEIEKTYFSQLGAIHSFEHDLHLQGEIQQGTLQRYINEVATFSAEALDAPQSNAYEYEFDGEHFYNVDGTRMRDMLTNGLEAAWNDYRKNPANEFEYTRAVIDAARLQTMAEIMEDDTPDTFFVISAFPEEAEEEFGTDHLSERGYQPNRKLAFARIYQKVDSQTLQETIVSLDNSEKQTFKKVLADFGINYRLETTEDILDTPVMVDSVVDANDLKAAIVSSYDMHKEAENPGYRFKQGRKLEGNKQEIDSWQFVDQNQDLVREEVQLLADMASVRTGMAVSEKLESFLSAALEVQAMPWSKRSHIEAAQQNPETLLDDESVEAIRGAITYMFAATMRRRFDAANERGGLSSVKLDGFVSYDDIVANTEIAIRNLERIIGCGGVQDMFDSAEAEELRRAALASSEAYAFDKVAHCVACDPEGKKPPVACGPCDICWRCDVAPELVGRRLSA